ncbi:MAG: LssY C-terminal domain-containing protein [Candidatus Acidiferrales bacterium]
MLRLRKSVLSLALLALLTGAAPSAASKDKLSLKKFTERVPTRAADKDATPGDMVNFVLVGSREQVEKALKAAGWKQVDRTEAEAVLRIAISILNKEVYTELPMSELFLFGRAQDFGYARAEPVAVIAERHHFRLWESPWKTSEGDTIWLGAGTHDIGFEEDRRTGDITHRIDPEVDKERELIGATLRETGRVAGFGYVRLPKPVREATTAHGGPYRSDGRVLVLLLK